MDVTAQLAPGWNILTGYAYTDAEVTKDNDTSLVAKRLANVGHVLQRFEPLFFGEPRTVLATDGLRV